MYTADVDTATNATTAIGYPDTAIEAVSNQRAVFAAQNQMTHAVDNLTNVKVNAEASRSRILTRLRRITAELARTQIIQQAGTAMLAQANQLPPNSAHATSAVRHTAVKVRYLQIGASGFFAFD